MNHRRVYIILAGRADGSTREVEVHGWGSQDAMRRAMHDQPDMPAALEPGETIITIDSYQKEKIEDAYAS